MAGTTTNFAIQYPSSTDYVTDGATAMKTISDDVDAILFAEVANQNLIINGAMQVSQRSAVGTAVTGITTTGYSTADRFNTTITTLGTWSQTTFVDAPAGKGFKNSLKMACTTADASPAAGDLLQIQQKIEGQNLQAVRKGTASAQILTLSFWVAAFQTGTFICELVAGSRACSKAYTINASNTWEYKSLTFPADATTVIANDNTEGLAVNWWLGAGTTYTSGTLQTTWAATVSANRAVGQTNVASSTSNTWLMTGASLTIGDADVPFQFKSFADDLAACQRYCTRLPAQGNTAAYAIFGTGIGRTGAATIVDFNIPLPTTMRVSPTGADVFNLRATDTGTGYTFTSFTLQTTESSPNCVSMSGGGGSGITGFRPYFITSNNNATGGYASFYAEL